VHALRDNRAFRAWFKADYRAMLVSEGGMRYLVSIFLVSGAVLGMAPDVPVAQTAAPPLRTLDDRFTVPDYTASEWPRRAAYLREHILASAGLLPMPEKAPLRPQVFGEQRREHYSVAKVYFESLPGFYVAGNLYRPTGTGPFPAILSPHGHWQYGRLENTQLTSAPARAINLARQGFVVFTYDMVGYNDSRQLPHTVSHGSDRDFGGRRENLWGLSLAGLQLWNGIRALDFLDSLPEVDRDRIGCTGESGGGTQTFLLSAVDRRIKVSAPVNMISLQMQGGCLCENQPGLRLDTNNVELAATIAPRPLLMVSATGDWTKETLEVEYPAMRRLYALAGAEDRVHAVRFDAQHNYNRESREAVYAWMARWLKNAAPTTRVAEREFRVEALPDLLVFYGRPLPDGAVTREQFTEAWIAAAVAQLNAADPQPRQAALRHALALEPRRDAASAPRRSKTVLLAGADSPLEAALTRAGFAVRRVAMTAFDTAAAEKISHFETYNRTAASQRVADIARAVGENAQAHLVATGDAALAAILAVAIAPAGRAILDVEQFDNTSDAAFVERLYIPGIRRAGDLQTAASMTSANVVIHNAGSRFKLERVRVEPRKLTPDEIVRILRRN
jgi:dienelactone hydrolase